MNKNIAEAVILGNIEALDQGIDLVKNLTDEQYQHVASPFVTSNIGQHFRHLVDLFFSLVNGSESGEIDYDFRRRGADIESSRFVAVSEMNSIKGWLTTLKENSVHLDELDKPVSLKSEVTLSQTSSVTFDSTMLRELVFTSSHAVHHYAIINIIAKMQGVETNNALGIAPSTASFLRDSMNKYNAGSESECAQ